MSLKRPEEAARAVARSGALIGPSGVGKTTTALAMLMGPYKYCYPRVYVVRPPVLKAWTQLGTLGASMFESI